MIFLTVNDIWNNILKVGHQVTNHPVYGWTLKSLHFFYRGADKPLARPGRKQATATEDFEFHISYL